LGSLLEAARHWIADRSQVTASAAGAVKAGQFAKKFANQLRHKRAVGKGKSLDGEAGSDGDLDGVPLMDGEAAALEEASLDSGLDKTEPGDAGPQQPVLDEVMANLGLGELEK
jgi:hypothetical protein